MSTSSSIFNRTKLFIPNSKNYDINQPFNIYLKSQYSNLTSNSVCLLLNLKSHISILKSSFVLLFYPNNYQPKTNLGEQVPSSSSPVHLPSHGIFFLFVFIPAGQWIKKRILRAGQAQLVTAFLLITFKYTLKNTPTVTYLPLSCGERPGERCFSPVRGVMFVATGFNPW